MFGGGVEIRASRSRLAFRVTVEDQVDLGRTYDGDRTIRSQARHSVATRFGVVLRIRRNPATEVV